MLPNFGPETHVGTLAGGGMYIARGYSGAPVAAVEMWFRAPSMGFADKATPSLARLAAESVASSKPIVGDSIARFAAARGGRLSITAWADSLSISLVVPASDAPAAVAAMTRSYFAPVVTDDGINTAKRNLAQEALIDSFTPDSVVRDQLFATLFSGGPLHYPTLGAARDIADIGADAVRAYAKRAFRSQNAILVVAGARADEAVRSAIDGRSATDATAAVPEPFTASTLSAAPVPVVKPFDERADGVAWVGPPIASVREATALDFIADYLFRPDAGTVTRDLTLFDPDASVAAQFVTLHDPGVFFLIYSGKDEAPLRARIEDAVAGMQKPLSKAAFGPALAAFEYHLLSDIQTPAEIADNYGWYTVEGNPEYAPGVGGDDGRYFTAARSLTPEFIAETARKYLGATPARVTLMPKAAKAASK